MKNRGKLIVICSVLALGGGVFAVVSWASVDPKPKPKPHPCCQKKRLSAAEKARLERLKRKNARKKLIPIKRVVRPLYCHSGGAAAPQPEEAEVPSTGQEIHQPRESGSESGAYSGGYQSAAPQATAARPTVPCNGTRPDPPLQP